MIVPHSEIHKHIKKYGLQTSARNGLVVLWNGFSDHFGHQLMNGDWELDDEVIAKWEAEFGLTKAINEANEGGALVPNLNLKD